MRGKVNIYWLFLMVVLIACNQDNTDSNSGSNGETPNTMDSTNVVDGDANNGETLTDNESEHALDLHAHSEQLLQAAVENKFAEVCQLMAYSGNDEARFWRESLDPKEDDDLYTAEATSEAIKYWIGEGSWTFGGTVIQNKNGFEVHILEVLFDSETIFFAFIKTDDSFLLADMHSTLPEEGV